MHHPLSPLEIARLEESRQAVGVAEISLESESIAGGTMCFGGIGSFMNQGQGIGLAGPVTGEELDRFVEFFTSRGVEPKIEVCPFVDATLVAGLEKRGFTLLEFENILYREIGEGERGRGQLNFSMQHPWPDGVTIVAVDPEDDTQVNTFVEITCGGFLPDGATLPEAMRKDSTRAVKHSRSKSFLAMLDGSAIGGGGMEVTPDVSCLFGASVLPPFRRRGIQSALILRRLQHAWSCGCNLVAIHSKPGIPTERNAARLGFHVAYTKAIMRMAAT
ncbi:MAG: GNAT superfamily N-acetyltransferase [Verrucomicrobiales bacterium]|jgi:GNAT superfamily N-acetyltransferase